MINKLLRLCLVAVLIGGVIGIARAQESAPSPDASIALDTGVYVTTQDIVSLRQGPGRDFPRVAVVDAAVTLMAVGRSPDGRWFQVDSNGQLGWIFYTLLVWSGDIAQLPVDGVNPAPFVRVYRDQVFVPVGTPLYYRQVTPQDFAFNMTDSTLAEITAHLGSGTYYWVQLNYNGQLYWTGSWALGIVSVGRNSFDTSYLYNYSRVTDQLAANVNQSDSTLFRINDIWVNLAVGSSVSCNSAPQPVDASRALDADVASLPQFEPLLRTLRGANDRINRAVAVFVDACSRPADQFFITQTEVVSALSDIEVAGRDLLLVRSLLSPLTQRDPIEEILNPRDRNAFNP